VRGAGRLGNNASERGREAGMAEGWVLACCCTCHAHTEGQEQGQ
jgi:hypothetical protein